MKIIELYPNTKAFEFEELHPYKTYVYGIERKDKVYIIDSFCGSFYMDEIKKLYKEKKCILINTHYHFDHIWGNITFKDSPIYAHTLCCTKIKEKAEKERKENETYFKGIKEILSPTHTFIDTLHLEEDLSLIYTPGHTIDSISILDLQNKAIYVGDNVERPLIQLEEDTLKEYKDSLTYYLSLKEYQFHSGHTLYINQKNILDTLFYITNFKKITFHEPEKQNIHNENKNKLYSL